MIRTKKQIGWRILSKTFLLEGIETEKRWKEWEELIQKNIEEGYVFDGNIQQSTVSSHLGKITLTIMQRMAKWEEIEYVDRDTFEKSYEELLEKLPFILGGRDLDDTKSVLEVLKDEILGKDEK